MPHGWALAELWLLMRDALAYEDGNRLVLLAGVPRDWAVDVIDLPTAFGRLSIRRDGTRVTIGGEAKPPGGFVVEGTRIGTGAGAGPRSVNRIRR
jgi:hypothetical protein